MSARAPWGGGFCYGEAEGPWPIDVVAASRPDGAALARPLAGAVVMPDGPGGEAYMTYANFAVIRLYNHSDLYALSVGILADRLGR